MHCVYVGSAVKGRGRRSSCDARLVMLGDWIESRVLSQEVRVLSSFYLGQIANDIVKLSEFGTLFLINN